MHIHTPHARACRLINAHLAALAPRHPATCFVAAEGAAVGFGDGGTLPLLIAYDAAGEVVESLPCADEALGGGGGAAAGVERGDLVWWLEGVGVLGEGERQRVD